MKKSGARRDATQLAIRNAAVQMFSQLGYRAATLRALAEQIGIQAGSLYNYMENKQELLFIILYDIMSDLVASYEENVAPVADPGARLDAFVENHVEFHTSRKEEVFIGNMELRNLVPENYEKLIALRDKYQGYLRDTLEAGRTAGSFQIADTRMTAFAILGMLNSVANWYSPEGALSQAQIGAHYRELVRRMITG